MTPKEFAAVVDGFVWREEQEAEEDITIAWMTACLIRAKRFPSLKSLLEPSESKKLTPAKMAEKRRDFERLAEGNRVVVRGKR